MDPVVLDPDTLLSTTRSVRRRLELDRPVPRALVEECLRLALQAPTGGNRQSWRFLVVTDADRRAALADLYRAGWDRYVTEGITGPPAPPASEPRARDRQRRIAASARYLADHLHRVPVHVIPCIRPRTDDSPVVMQASVFGSILPAAWSFMLAARARGLGSAWTTIHLFHEREAAEVLGIPHDEWMQCALIPVAYALGDGFGPGVRRPLEESVCWDRWEG